MPRKWFKFWSIPFELEHYLLWKGEDCMLPLRWLDSYKTIEQYAKDNRWRFTKDWESEINVDRSFWEYGECGVFWIKGEWREHAPKRRQIMYLSY